MPRCNNIPVLYKYYWDDKNSLATSSSYPNFHYSREVWDELPSRGISVSVYKSGTESMCMFVQYKRVTAKGLHSLLEIKFTVH